MDCNKEEAVRARGIAEKRMQCRDFVGARKIALKAQQLFPDLENISQMLTVCEVHCSAETKVSGSEDWYRILQVEPTADESLIKKQYKKLAFLLHPDKNKFAGAESAFKLVGEAHRTLTDQAKRSLYDMKRKVTIPTVGQRPRPHQPDKSSNAKKQPGIRNIYQNNATAPFPQQQTQTAYAAQTFWTVCPSCGIRYQYYRTMINKALHCQKCSKPFIANDINARGMSPGLNSDHSSNLSGIQQNKDSQNQFAKSTGQQSPCMNAQGNSGGRPTVPGPGIRGGMKHVFGEGSRNEVKDKSQVDNGIKIEHKVKVEKVKLEKVNEKERVVQPSANPSRKHRRKMVVESSDSVGAESTDSDEIIIEESEYATAWDAEVTGCSPRRSTRQKHNVSYNEDSSSDDDVVTLIHTKQLRKKLHTDDQSPKSSSEDDDVVEVQINAGATTMSKSNLEGRKRGSISIEEDVENGNKLRKKCVDESGDFNVKDGSGGSSKGGVCPSPDDSKSELNSGTFTYPDPEFYDFGKDREQSCFDVDQIWAVYDNLDGMPRFYVQIRSVSSTGFKLRFTWLQYDPVGQAEMDWSDAELPVGCGNYIHGKKTENMDDILMFSHIVPLIKGSKRKSHGIYPRKGEAWAIFKDWDIKWSSNPDQHRQYEYEFVEILSDFSFDAGVNAAYLSKVKGFVSLFCHGGREGIRKLHVPSNELLRFSHMVPSYRMTGKEREGIPEGLYELDPGSLPSKLDETFASIALDEVQAQVENGGLVNGTRHFKSRTVERKSAYDLKNDFTFRNIEEANENIGVEKSLDSSDASVEGLNGACKKKHSRASGSLFTATEAERTVGGKGPSEWFVNKKENHLDTASNSRNNMEKNNVPMPKPSSSMDIQYPDPEFHNFESERSKGNFQTGQVWALYCEEDCFPKYYALVRKVNSEDLKVHVTWLEALSLLQEEIKWSDNDLPFACGRFRLHSGREASEGCLTLCTFSHLVQAELVAKGYYDIYPQVNEVWALYKNWNIEWKVSDIKNCSESGEYEVVEVLSSFASMVTVMILEKVDGFKAVFRSQRTFGVSNTMEIPRSEFLRFSHRIPSFRLTEEKGGKLRGYWELDPGSLPNILLRTSSD
uniref:Curved DNA-binding protein n=1 Tax=Anthurium amnicola TaxID=1678845 RepID=A0A1D1YUT1_9ARAE